MSTKDDVLGSIVTWNMKSTEIPAAKVVDALVSAGLSTSFFNEINARSGFSRAVKDLKENRSIDKLTESKDGKISFQLTRKELDTDGERLRFNYETVVVLDKQTGEIECEDREIEQQARELLDHAMSHRTSSDITKMVQAMFKSQCGAMFPINKQKGVAYYVPIEHKDTCDRIEQFFHACGGDFEHWPIYKTGEKSAQKAVFTGFESMIEELDALAEGWDEKTRDKTMSNAMDKYIELKHRVESYSTHLGGLKEQLEANLRATKEKILAKVKARTEVDEVLTQPLLPI